MSSKITITWDDVTALAPELATVSAIGQAQILAQVALQVTPAKWGSLEWANAGACWLARHIASLYGKGGTGVVTEVHAGSVGKSFASPMSMVALQSTRYGMEFLQLAKARLQRFAVT